MWRKCLILLVVSMVVAVPVTSATAAGAPIVGDEMTASLVYPDSGGWRLETTVDPNGLDTWFGWQIKGPNDSEPTCDNYWCDLQGGMLNGWEGTTQLYQAIWIDPSWSTIQPNVPYEVRVVGISDEGTTLGPAHTFTFSDGSTPDPPPANDPYESVPPIEGSSKMPVVPLESTAPGSINSQAGPEGPKGKRCRPAARKHGKVKAKRKGCAKKKSQKKQGGKGRHRHVLHPVK